MVIKVNNHDYIFAPIWNGTNTRWSWLENCLLGDLFTFNDGIKLYTSGEKVTDRYPRGGGNFSLLDAITTALEALSKLNAGGGSNAEDKVVDFINQYFPPSSIHKLFPHLLWQGIRNGVDHNFYPKKFNYDSYTVNFGADNLADQSVITLENNIISIAVSDQHLLRDTYSALEAYKLQLEGNAGLQERFKIWWDELEKIVPINLSDAKRVEIESILDYIRKN